MSLSKDNPISLFVLDFLLERGVHVDYSNLSKASFLNSGLIDSFAQMQLLFLIQDNFNVEITPEDIIQQESLTFMGLIELAMDRIKS